VLLPYLELFQELEQVVLQPVVPDKHIWRLSPTGKFSSKSAHMAMFQGSLLSAGRKNLEVLGPKQVQVLHMASRA
jgi:hypothetical protein